MSAVITLQHLNDDAAKNGPLAWLFARKDKNGNPFLSVPQYSAAIHLIGDFDRAGLQPKITMSWQETSVIRRSNAGNPRLDHASALEARQRLNNALKAIGQELASPLLDVCCYQFNIGHVEKKYSWPPRAGKIIIRLGLEALARHYGYLKVATGPVRDGAIQAAHTSDCQRQ